MVIYCFCNKKCNRDEKYLFTLKEIKNAFSSNIDKDNSLFLKIAFENSKYERDNYSLGTLTLIDESIKRGDKDTFKDFNRNLKTTCYLCLNPFKKEIFDIVEEQEIKNKIILKIKEFYDDSMKNPNIIKTTREIRITYKNGILSFDKI